MRPRLFSFDTIVGGGAVAMGRTTSGQVDSFSLEARVDGKLVVLWFNAAEWEQLLEAGQRLREDTRET